VCPYHRDMILSHRLCHPGCFLLSSYNFSFIRFSKLLSMIPFFDTGRAQQGTKGKKMSTGDTYCAVARIVRRGQRQKNWLCTTLSATDYHTE
jgi:hypothetical protein